MTFAKKTLSEIKLIHGNYGNFIKGQKLDKRKEKKYKTPPYQDLAASTEIDGEPLDEKCWPGYEKKGMKTMFGKRYPNCVKKKKKKTRKEEYSDWRNEFEQIDEKKMTKSQIKKRDEIADAISTREMNKRYGDKNVKYAIATKLAMKEDNIQEILDKKDVPHVKKLVGKLRKGSKTHAKQADDLEKALKEEPLTRQSLDVRKKAQKNVENKMNQQGAITTVNRKNGKVTSMSVAGGRNKDLFAKQLKKVGSDVKMDADGLVPNAGAVVQKKAEYGVNIAKKSMKSNPSKYSDQQKKDLKSADSYIKGGNLERDINRRIPGTRQHRLDIGADEVNLATQKYKPKRNKGIKFGMQKEDITDEALTIQDWNIDDIKFTEIETVDIIKAKPLKEDVDLDEKFQFLRKAFGKSIIRATGVDKAMGKFPRLSRKGSISLTTGKALQRFKDAIQKVKDLKKIDAAPTKFPRDTSRTITKTTDNIITIDPSKMGKKPRVIKKKNPPTSLGDHYDWRTELEEDWQKVNRKDKTDGLSRKAVKAYRRENPGSKLQTAVTKDPKKLKKGSKSAKRRLSFCRRMKGMKKKLTSAKTRRDPDSRINKALRRWNC